MACILMDYPYEFLTELYPHAVLVGYLAAKVALLVLREPVGVLASGEVVVDVVEFFFHSSYSCDSLMNAPSSAGLYALQ